MKKDPNVGRKLTKKISYDAPKMKPRKFYLVLFENILGEKTGHVYYSMREAREYNYPDREVVAVQEVQLKKNLKNKKRSR